MLLNIFIVINTIASLELTCYVFNIHLSGYSVACPM